MRTRLSPKTIAARAKSAKLMLPPGPDNAASRYYTGGGVVNARPEGMATGPQINLMAQPTYKSGMGECACGCGHRPGCQDFLAIASVGEAD